MKIHKINTFFKKMGQFQLRFRWPLIIIVLLLTILGITGLRHVEMANARDDWFDDKEAIEIATEEFEDQFGNNDNISILIEAEDVFAPEVLTMMKNIGRELVDSVPYADEITSLVDMEISVGTEDGIVVINPFEDGIPTDPRKLEEIRQLVLSRKALKGKIVSEDCTQTWLTLSLLEYPEKEDWEKVTNKDPMFQSGEAAIRIVTDPRWISEKYTLKAAGTPYTETEERGLFRAGNDETFSIGLYRYDSPSYFVHTFLPGRYCPFGHHDSGCYSCIRRYGLAGYWHRSKHDDASHDFGDGFVCWLFHSPD